MLKHNFLDSTKVWRRYLTDIQMVVNVRYNDITLRFKYFTEPLFSNIHYKVLRKIFGPQGDEVSNSGILDKKGLYDVYRTTHIVSIVISQL